MYTMCRLFAAREVSGDMGRVSSYLEHFWAQSKTGNVLFGHESGHRDGAGFFVQAARREWLYKTPISAVEDKELLLVSKIALESSGGVFDGIFHIRKMTHGAGLQHVRNSHPFVGGGMAFMHNGAVRIGVTDPYGEVACLCGGDTDSERLFQRMCVLVSTGLDYKNAWLTMLSETKELYKESYTALNTVCMTEGYIYASRAINETHPDYLSAGFELYYTLYIGRSDAGSVYISSQQIEMDGVTWQLIPNHTCVAIDRITGDVSFV